MSSLDFHKSKKKNCFNLIIQTFDAKIELQIDCDSKVRHLFDSICESLGLREVWYFGLLFEVSNDTKKWLKFHKKLSDIDLIRNSAQTRLRFCAKYFPQKPTDLIQDYTQHLFFSQLRDAILNGHILVSCEDTCIQLASYAAQSIFGDYNDSKQTKSILIKLIQTELPKMCKSTNFELLETKLKTQWIKLDGLLKEEAEFEYLQVAFSLEMCGLAYYLVINKKRIRLWLAISPHGIKIFPFEQKLKPMQTFKWSEIHDFSLKKEKFKIKANTLNDMNNQQTFSFIIEDPKKDSKNILDLCIGYHDLYKNCRLSDTIQIQQMRQHAIEVKNKREFEKIKLLNERRMRIDAEKHKNELDEKLKNLEKYVKHSIEAQKKAEEAASILSERVKLAEEETKLLSIKSSKLEAQVNLYKIIAEKKEREKRFYEYKTVESELILNHIIDKFKSNSTSVNGSTIDLRTGSTIISVDKLENLENELNRRLSLENDAQKLHKIDCVSKKYDLYCEDMKNSQSLICHELNEPLGSDRKSTLNLATSIAIKLPNEHSNLCE